jgi:hypothetical protein
VTGVQTCALPIFISSVVDTYINFEKYSPVRNKQGTIVVFSY